MKKRTTKKTETMTQPQAVAEVEAADLDANAASALELAHLKAESAKNAAEARKAELENIILQVRARYEENGKYTVLQIDAGTKKVHRVRTLEKAGPFREPASAPTSGGDQPQG